MKTADATRVLGSADPAPVIRQNTGGKSPFLLIGDHAGVAIPASLGDLGLPRCELDRHIACDIGVRGLGEALAQQLDAVFIHQHYSRLAIDCNRDPAAPDAIPERSDGTEIPGNIGITATQAAERIAQIHAPYQDAIATEIARRRQIGLSTVLVSLHSFTPVMAGIARPWQIGVLHGGGNAAFAHAMLAVLEARGDLVVGDNAPYRMDMIDHTVPRHAFAPGLGYVELEIRQDLIADEEGQRRWSELVAKTLRAALEFRPTGSP